MKEARRLEVLQAMSLRELVDKVNSINASSSPIKIGKDDILCLQRLDDSFILLYYC